MHLACDRLDACALQCAEHGDGTRIDSFWELASRYVFIDCCVDGSSVLCAVPNASPAQWFVFILLQM